MWTYISSALRYSQGIWTDALATFDHTMKKACAVWTIGDRVRDTGTARCDPTSQMKIVYKKISYCDIEDNICSTRSVVV